MTAWQGNVLYDGCLRSGLEDDGMAGKCSVRWLFKIWVRG